MDVNLAQMSAISANASIGLAASIDVLKLQLNSFQNSGNDVIALLNQGESDNQAQPYLGHNIDVRV